MNIGIISNDFDIPPLVLDGSSPLHLVKELWHLADQAKWQSICPHCIGNPCVGWDVMYIACGCAIESLPGSPLMSICHAAVCL